MWGDVQAIETIFNIYKNNLGYKIKSSWKTLNQLMNQVAEQADQQCRLVQSLRNMAEHFQGYSRENEGMLRIVFYHC